jgi:hypothetical protein
LNASDFSSRLLAALRRAILSNCLDAIQLQLSLYSAIYSRRNRHRGTEGIGLIQAVGGGALVESFTPLSID